MSPQPHHKPMRPSLLLPPPYRTFRLAEATGAQSDWTLGNGSRKICHSVTLTLRGSMAFLSQGCCFSVYICFSVPRPVGLLTPSWAHSLILLHYPNPDEVPSRPPPQGLLCASLCPDRLLFRLPVQILMSEYLRGRLPTGGQHFSTWGWLSPVRFSSSFTYLWLSYWASWD